MTKTKPTVDELEKQVKGIKDQIAKLKLHKAIVDAFTIKVILMGRGLERERTLYFENESPGIIAIKRTILDTVCDAKGGYE